MVFDALYTVIYPVVNIKVLQNFTKTQMKENRKTVASNLYHRWWKQASCTSAIITLVYKGPELFSI